MNFPKKADLKVAAVTRNNFDLSSSTVTTNDFGFLKPVFVRNTYPNESFHCKPETFVRTAPLVAPTFGRCKINFDTFFVRFDQIWRAFPHLLDGTKYTDGYGSSSFVTAFPYFTNDTIYDALLYKNGTRSDGFRDDLRWVTVKMSSSGVISLLSSDLFSSTELESIKSGITPWIYGEDIYSVEDFQRCLEFDIPINEQSPLPKGDLVTSIVTSKTGLNEPVVTEYTFVYFNAKQKHFLDLFYSLGYGVNFVFGNLSSHTTSGVITHYPLSDSTKLNPMRILAFFKVYIDWYESNQFTESSVARSYLERILSSSSSSIGPLILSNFMDCLQCCYEPDLYTSSYTTPQGMPIDSNLLSQTGSPVIPTDPEAENIEISSTTGATHNLLNLSTNATTLHLLEKIQSFISRFRVGGQRDIDTYLSEFGVKSKAVDAKRSVLINHYSQPLQISDVMSTADTTGTDGAQLGAYAGKGVSFGSDSWSFDCNDYGVILSICTITPVTGYVYGREKETEISKLTDLYTPDFDGIGMEALSFAQLNTEQSRRFSRSVTPSSVFGYVPRYAHMKVGNDILSGDFRVNTLKQGLDSWHLFRKFDTLSPYYNDIFNSFVTLANDERFRKVNAYAGVSQLVSSPDFGDLSVYSSEDYDRIFDITDSREDHFLIFCNWQLHAERSMKSISDIYDLNHPLDGESHRTVSVDYNGKQL